MSGRKRFFVEKIDYPETLEVELGGEEFVHAKTVQRVEEGSEIILLDGSGKEYSAIVATIGKRSLLAHITGAIEGSREPETPIYLLCGALKGDKTELVVQKACELGASKIGIFNSKYCAAFMNDNKIERLNKVSREAAKQCMRSKAPEVVYFNDLKSALLSADDYKDKFFACEFAKDSQRELSTISGACALVVGSEGGFCEEEATLAEECGFSLITLGKRILRAETAAIAVMSVAAYYLGELK
jgi:16S rRNA (uracil1498-N3)-methyltransferase